MPVNKNPDPPNIRPSAASLDETLPLPPHRAWVIPLAVGLFLIGLGYGVLKLIPNYAQLASSRPVAPPPLRGKIEASDGTPLAVSDTQNLRLYPLGSSAAQLVGMVERQNSMGMVKRKNSSGLEGLERDMDVLLTSGQSLRLTLDPAIQSLAELALWRALDSSRADWGTALVMEVRSGRLLGVANGPAFDPTAPRPDPTKDISWRNHAFLEVLEPGSTIKTLSAAVLLQENVAGLDTRVEAPMARRVGRWVINDVVAHPKVLTLAEVLKYSSNVGISRLAERIPVNRFYPYFEQLRFTTRELLPGIRIGNPIVREAPRWGPLEYANATFGQGFLVTPLHLAVAYNTVANDGVFVQPVLTADRETKAEQVFRPEVARSIRRALTAGLVQRAALSGYALGGKTGTAQVVVDGRYSSTVYSASFAGFVPSDRPQATVVVVVFNPKGDRINGSQVAAPVYREIAAGLLAYWGRTPAETPLR